MSKNSTKQQYTQLVEWLESVGKRTSNSTAKKSRFSDRNQKEKK